MTGAGSHGIAAERPGRKPENRSPATGLKGSASRVTEKRGRIRKMGIKRADGHGIKKTHVRCGPETRFHPPGALYVWSEQPTTLFGSKSFRDFQEFGTRY